MMSVAQRKLLLIGGGHSHLAVLADWIINGRPTEQATLISPHSHLRYSGMVPGWIAGEYDEAEGRVDIAALAERAGVRFVQDRCVGIEPDQQRVQTKHNGDLEFDICSINTGGIGRAQKVLGEDPRILDVRPIEGFLEGLGTPANQRPEKTAQIAIIGGGAGGLELAFALNNHTHASEAAITLVAGAEGLLPSFGGWGRRLVRAELERQGIALLEHDASLRDGVLQAGPSDLAGIDVIVAALGSGAPDWPGESGLAVDADGFIAVDAHQRSISHPTIFAVGDIAARQDVAVTHSGVHAVHAGPVIAANLRSALSGTEPARSYIPRPASLYLLATGNGSAIGTYGPFAAQGKWVHQLKQWIDKRWTASYAKLAHGV